ncbi:MAG TPA: Hsp20/alpha crystallin family protein [Geobacteraceae bacterium]|nr:Hsp20/alpha crystallin family protein [Geobacteraceae bacterium]
MSAKLNKEAVKREPRELTVSEPHRFLTPFEDMERWFEEAFRRPFLGPSWMPRIKLPEIMGEVSPSVDIFEDGNNVVVKAEVPGMKKEEIEVNLTQDTITISGHKKEEEKVEKKDFYRLERTFGSFTRKLRLPSDILTDKAKATFKDGVLEVRIPKSPTARAKKIAID